MNTCRFTIAGMLSALMLIVDMNEAFAQQPIYQIRLAARLIKKARFEKLPPAILALVDSAITHYDHDVDRSKSVEDLKRILGMQEVRTTNSLFRAWVHQWLALNYFALDSSLSLVEQHVKRSLKENLDIWREYPDLKRLPEEVKDIYQLGWEAINEEFEKQWRSVRIALGPITRLDLSYRLLSDWDLVGGIGTPIQWRFEEDEEKVKTKAFDQLVLYTRIQRMHKYIKNLSAGIYLGFTLEEDTSKTGIQFPRQ
ncbi:MAG: hypothetical protein ONA90_10095, partial [candidate division KSB1 bacterium]|nr:hypothetical protein [candidate division KSB1 bacterium]